MNLTIKDFQNSNWHVFPESRMFNNGHIEIVAPSHKNNNPNISDYFLIVAKLLSMFYSLITSRSSLGV